MSRASECRNAKRRMYTDFKETLDYYKGVKKQHTGVQQQNANPVQQQYGHQYPQHQQYQQYQQYGQQQQYQQQYAQYQQQYPQQYPQNGGQAKPAPSGSAAVAAAAPPPPPQSVPPPPPQSYSEPYNNPAYEQQYAAYYQQNAQGYAGEDDTEEKLARKNQVSMKHDANYNINTLLASNIRQSQYFKDLYEKTTFAQVVDEIYYKVDHVEPWMAAPSRAPSTGFCLLYKLFTMKLTRKQMTALLDHPDSPYIRALGFLHLRYTCPPEELWEWVEPYIEDKEEFKATPSANRTITMGEWLEGLLTEQKYYGTLLPRIPKKIELDLQVNILKKTRPHEVAELKKESRESEQVFRIKRGLVVRARYSEDGKWYDARIEEPGKKRDSWWVTYLPEDEYGNQEEVSEKNIKPLESNKASRKRDETLRKKIMERNRNSATTLNKSDYSKSITTFKTAISMPLSNRRRADSPPPMDSRGSKTAEEALKKRGQLGHVESVNIFDSKSDKKDPEKKKSNRAKEELLARYGNAAKTKRKK